MKKRITAILAGTLALALTASPFISMKVFAEPAEVLEEDEETDFTDPEEFFEVLLEAIEVRNATIDSSEIGDLEISEAVFRFTREYETVQPYEDAIFEEEDLDAAVQMYFNALRSMMLMDTFVEDYYSLEQEDRSLVCQISTASMYYVALDYMQENYGLELPENETEGIEGMYEFYAPLFEDMRGNSGSSEPATVHESEEDEEVTEEIEVTTGMSNALRAAKSYLRFTAFSYEGLIDMLEYDGYKPEERKYAADNCGADWNEQALKAAESYLDVTAFSYEGLIEMLEYDGFTTEEAEYAAENCEADWYEQAVKAGESYLKYTSFSHSGLIDMLEYDGFTHEEAKYAADQLYD